MSKQAVDFAAPFRINKQSNQWVLQDPQTKRCLTKGEGWSVYSEETALIFDSKEDAEEEIQAQGQNGASLADATSWARVEAVDISQLNLHPASRLVDTSQYLILDERRDVFQEGDEYFSVMEAIWRGVKSIPSFREGDAPPNYMLFRRKLHSTPGSDDDE